MPTRSRAPSARKTNGRPPSRPDPRLSVFINCPYDDAYAPLLDALVFTAVCCGFEPRIASESGATDVPRMERIVNAIFDSSYSIHDLARYKGEGEQLLARLNMPLELGMVVGRQFVSEKLEAHDFEAYRGKSKAYNALADDLVELARRHRWLVLVPDGVDPNRFISDLGGYDLKKYKNDVASIVPAAMSWFYAMPDAVGGLQPSQVLPAFAAFRIEMVRLRTEWAENLLWRDVLDAAKRHAPRA